MPPVSPGDRIRAGLPPAARRWLEHAVRPGAEGVRRAELRMHGEILVGRWRPFRARQVIEPPAAFTWSAVAGRGPLAVRGADRFADGEGRMDWRVLGIPVMRARGADVSRSAAGRLAGEIVLCPPAALDPRVGWSPGPDDARATFHVTVGGWEHAVTVTVDEGGTLTAVDMARWGAPQGGPYGLHPFHVACEGGLSEGGVTIPRAIRAGWGGEDGAPGEFFRATIDEATFR
jgi:hypothetical protein